MLEKLTRQLQYEVSFFFEKLDEPRLIDRLPSADFIGKINFMLN